MEQKSQRVPVMLEPSLLKEIDDYRFSQRIGSRGEIVRLLLRDGLKIASQRKENTDVKA